MRQIQLSNDIVSVGELKVQAARLLRRLHEDRRPIVITQHGKAAGVLVSPEDFDRLTETARFVESVRMGLADSEAGKLIDDDDLDAMLDKVMPLKVRK